MTKTEKLQAVKADLKELKNTVHLINAMLKAKNDYLYKIKTLSHLNRIKAKEEAQRLKKVMELMKIEEYVSMASKIQTKYMDAIGSLDVISRAIAIDYFINGTPAWKIACSLNFSEEGIRKRLTKIVSKIAEIV